MKKKYYLLRYSYDYGEKLEYDKTIEVGIFSSLTKAIVTKNKILNKSKKLKKGNLIIECYEINQDTFWKEGFIDAEE